jgi:radical SAM protein with 4Fe4S-binding SPASM domain
MSILGKSIIPGINIYSRVFDLNYLRDYFLEFELKKEIRLGIAHPVLSQNNQFLHPKHYPVIGMKIAEFKKELEPIGVRIGFDCGFVPCMFPQDSFQSLNEELQKAGTCCHPLLDMLSDGTFISCYPLNNLLKIKLHDHLIAPELISQFNNELRNHQDVGIYPVCSSCPLFQNRCNGGCMAFRIHRFMHSF